MCICCGPQVLTLEGNFLPDITSFPMCELHFIYVKTYPCIVAWVNQSESRIVYQGGKLNSENEFDSVSYTQRLS